MLPDIHFIPVSSVGTYIVLLKLWRVTNRRSSQAVLVLRAAGVARWSG